MPCPTESRTLDEFEDASPTYTNRQGSKVRNRLTESGIVVYNAVLVGGVEEGPKEDYKAKLEELLDRSINAGEYVDSAWEKKCDHCKEFRYKEFHKERRGGWDRRTYTTCSCDLVTCRSHERCKHCSTDCECVEYP